MADGKNEVEWSNFSESPSCCSTSFPGNQVLKSEEENNDEWFADFNQVCRVTSNQESEISSDSCECGGDGIQNKTSLDNDLNDFTNLCFGGETENISSVKNDIHLSDLWVESPLYTSLQISTLNPLQFQNTYFHQLKMRTVGSLLGPPQVEEKWLSALDNLNTRLYEDVFDFHSSIGEKTSLIKNNHKAGYLTETVLTDNSYLPDTNMKKKCNQVNFCKTSIVPVADAGKSSERIEKKSLDQSKTIINELEIRETVLTDNSYQPDNNMKKKCNQEDFCKTSIVPVSDAGKYPEGIENRSLDELKTIVDKLESQTNAYSNMLLIELDCREKLRRDIEEKNKLISSYVAVERKLNDRTKNKKKKSNYSFFKYKPDESKISTEL